MTTFGARLRELRRAGGLSLADLAERVPCDKGHLSRVENDHRRPTAELVRRLDAVLGADGDLLIRAGVDETDAGGLRAGETAELLRRLRTGDAAPATLEAISCEVTELCCQYAWRDPRSLRREAHAWFREAARLLHRSVGLAAHRELLVAAGWLALLAGCLENDLCLTRGAEATRAAARRLGDEAGHAGIVAWSWELAAWFALTRGHPAAALSAARTGRRTAGDGSDAAAQLLAHEARALAMIGNRTGARAALDGVFVLLDRLPEPARPDHHFAVEPAKWDFLAMQVHGAIGDDRRAGAHARAVLQAGGSPRRLAAARSALAGVAEIPPALAAAGDRPPARAVGVERAHDGENGARAVVRSLPDARRAAA